MVAFIISFLFAVGQIFMLKSLMVAITSGNRKKSIGLFFLKFSLYGVAIAVFMFKFLKFAVSCFLGFAVGMPVCALFLFIYFSFVKNK